MFVNQPPSDIIVPCSPVPASFRLTIAEAMGSALVKLRAGGKLYSGNGISTDVIGASIRAYISALNKIVYEEA